MELSDVPERRLDRMLVSLTGLSVGDAFGQRFFAGDPTTLLNAVGPPGSWPFTDDSQMALSVAAVLRRRSVIDQDELAASFAERFDPRRDYGWAMYELLIRLRKGEPWRPAAAGLYGGSGSYGSGAAMRVSPLGAYFADDVEQVVVQATLSATVTHTHPEAVAGAIAVAMSSALAWRYRATETLPGIGDFMEAVLPVVPLGTVRSGIEQAQLIGGDSPIDEVAGRLGNGNDLSAVSTVPFVLWCAARYLDDYGAALRQIATARGDMDTNCAIAGGIIAGYTGIDGIPEAWLESREPLPVWLTDDAAPDQGSGPAVAEAEVAADGAPGEALGTGASWWSRLMRVLGVRG